MKKAFLIILVVFASLISSGQMYFGHNQYVVEQLGYGLLYNWYAVSDANFAPTDWKVPTYTEVQTLATTLGGQSIAGGKIKETGTTHWDATNLASNSSNFSLYGSGFRQSNNGLCRYLKTYAYLWTQTTHPTDGIWYYNCINTDENISYSNFARSAGCAIRLLYTGAGTPTTITDYDGNIYDVVLIGTQYWTVQNWKCKHLSKSPYTAISEVTDNATWAALTTGAWCYYNNDPSNE